MQKKKTTPLCHVPASSDMADYLNLNCLLWIHYFFFIIIDFDQIKLWFSQKRFSAIGSYDFAYTIYIALLQIPLIFIIILYIYIFSSNLHKVSCLLERVLVILHNINGILGFVRDISTCKIYIYMVIIVKCIFYTVIDTCTWKQ